MKCLRVFIVISCACSSLFADGLLKISLELWSGVPKAENSKLLQGPTFITDVGSPVAVEVGQQIEGFDSALGVTASSLIDETEDGLCYKIQMIVRKLSSEQQQGSDELHVLDVQEYLLRGPVVLGEAKQFKIDDQHTLVLLIQPYSAAGLTQQQMFDQAEVVPVGSDLLKLTSDPQNKQ